MPLPGYKTIDLTHVLNTEAPTWNGSCGFTLEVKKDYDQLFRVQQIKMHAGVGTHLDAPSHRFSGAPSIDDLVLDRLIAPACVIDVSKKAGQDYEISVEDVERYEKTYGKIPENALIIGYTGWDRFWNDKNKYRNVDERGLMHFPAFSGEAADFLVSRKIAGIAIDTLSPDCQDQGFPVHVSLLGSGRYIIENIANASKMPPKGAYVIALPIHAHGATEAPARVIALVPV